MKGEVLHASPDKRYHRDRKGKVASLGEWVVIASFPDAVLKYLRKATEKGKDFY